MSDQRSPRGFKSRTFLLLIIIKIVYSLPTAVNPPESAQIFEINSAAGTLRGSSSLLGVVNDELEHQNEGEVSSSLYKLAPGQEENADLGTPFSFDSVKNPQPIRGDLGGTDPGPRTLEYDRLNPDTLAPPGSDSGDMEQGKWPLGLSHNRILPGRAGWSRQENTHNLPSATEMAGVDMKLAPWAYRELHWHGANEWGIILNGSVRVQTMNEDGQTFTDDVAAGDVWYFPTGLPHSIQALDQGAEFMLIFDQGDFSDSETSLVSEMFLRTPKEVWSKNLQAPVSDFDRIPRDQLYIFNGSPAPGDLNEQVVEGPAGVASGNSSYTYHFSKQPAYETPGGSIKIIDPLNFPIAERFSVALVTIKPGAMREVHWSVCPSVTLKTFPSIKA